MPQSLRHFAKQGGSAVLVLTAKFGELWEISQVSCRMLLGSLRLLVATGYPHVQGLGQSMGRQGPLNTEVIHRSFCCKDAWGFPWLVKDISNLSGRVRL